MHEIVTGEVTMSSSLNFVCQRSVLLRVVRYCFSSLMVVFLGLSVINIIPDIEEQQQSINVFERPKTNKSSVASNQLPSIESYAQNKYNKTTEGLKLIWLMSFPNSGTTYTLQLIRETTLTATGTNYADEVPMNDADYRHPVYSEMPDGPFWYQQASKGSTVALSKPKNYLLTKTHCGLRCMVCSPEEYSESTYSFRQKCFQTIWTDDINVETGKRMKRFSSYEPDHVYKAIHILRDPFDNIVSRFQYDNKKSNPWAANYSTSREGFRAYCRVIDDLHKMNEKRISFLSDNLLEIMKDVPCRADFFRYVEWHNQAFVTTHELDFDVYILKYDHYTSRFNETLNEILRFLHLPFHKDGHLPLFTSGKVYREYFTLKEQRAVAEAFEIMSSSETWFHIKPYFSSLQ